MHLIKSADRVNIKNNLSGSDNCFFGVIHTSQVQFSHKDHNNFFIILISKVITRLTKIIVVRGK
jgi:hypothetical protein